MARQPRFHPLSERIASISAIDGPARAVAKKVRGLLPAGGGVKDVISGTWLGHPLHPVLTDVPIGTWTSATLLDLLGGEAGRPAAQRLIGVGLVAAVPTALSGATDWADTEPASDGIRRLGAVHAVANSAALLLYGSSLVARRRGAHATGVLLGVAGAGAVAAGGWLGGDLSFARGVGVNESLFCDEPADWTPVLDASMLAENRPAHALVGDLSLVIVQRDGKVHALADRCSHRGGKLHQGELEGDCIACPLHGTRFRLEDGGIERGPAAYPQPVYEAQVHEGRVEVRAGG